MDNPTPVAGHRIAGAIMAGLFFAVASAVVAAYGLVTIWLALDAERFLYVPEHHPPAVVWFGIAAAFAAAGAVAVADLTATKPQRWTTPATAAALAATVSLAAVVVAS